MREAIVDRDPLDENDSRERLLDNKAMRERFGVTEHAADAIMRQVPKVIVPGLKKVYVRAGDVLDLIDRSLVS